MYVNLSCLYCIFCLPDIIRKNVTQFLQVVMLNKQFLCLGTVLKYLLVSTQEPGIRYFVDVQQAPSVTHQMEHQPAMQFAFPSSSQYGKCKEYTFVSVCLNSIYRSVTHHKDVMLYWVDLFPSEFVWKPGTCCCLHSLLSVGDGGTSLLSCTGLVHQRIQFFEDLIRSPRFRAFERTDAVSTLFTRYITERSLA